MKYNYISLFKINSNFDIEIEFDNKYKNIYTWITDLYFNKDIKSDYYYDIIDYSIKNIWEKDYELIWKAFWIKYSKKFLNNNIKWKFKLLQIEW